MTTTSAPSRIDPNAIARMSRSELDRLFRDSPAGPIPAGRARGTAILLPGTAIDRAIAAFVRVLVWKGKVFSSATADL